MNIEHTFQIVKININSMNKIVNKFGQLLMHEAAANNSIGCLSILLSKKTNPNALDSDGMTPLHYA
ncbi:ankyrin repeat domain-containing protein [Thalassolituus oleivorans]|uniref:ankyrin repeat domain-containing protein n=1 Tax=Thalassolituus oleivorans TaxID=187493 RepID=UPI003C6F337B